MKKSLSSKTILKDAGVLLTIAMIVLSTVVAAETRVFQSPPNKPNKPTGPTEGDVGVEYTFMTSVIDPDGDNVYFWGTGMMEVIAVG